MEPTAFSEAARQAAARIQSCSPSGTIDFVIIAPRAFQGVSDLVQNPATLPYAELPGFPIGDGVEPGEAFIGGVDGLSVLFLLGVPAFAATGDPGLMSGPFETIAALGARCALMLDVAHSVNADCAPGSLVAVSDHINFSGLDPLIGDPAVAAPIDMNEVYDQRLLRRLKLAATTAGVPMQDGVLMWFSGPSYQTPAEARVARLLKADLIGWRVAPEAILARRMQIPFAALVIIPGYAAGFRDGAPSSEETKTGISTATITLRRFLKVFLRAG